MIAQEITLNYPEKVEKLVLCGTYCGGKKAVYPSQEMFESIAGLGILSETLSEEEIAGKVLKLFFTDEFLERNPAAAKSFVKRILKAPISRGAFTRQLEAVLGFDSYDRLPQIKVPTLVLHGKKDIIVPMENALILTRSIPDARLYSGNSAHWLGEEREQVLRILLDFLGS